MLAENESSVEFSPFDNPFSAASHLPERLRQRLERRNSLLSKSKSVPLVGKDSELQSSSLDEDIWLSLPDEVTLLCFAYLAIWDLCQIQLVCRLWNRISRDNYIGTQLDFSKFSKRVSEGVVTHILSKAPQLTKLNLSGCSSLTNNVFPLIPQFCPLLTYLDLSGCTRATDTTLHGLIRFTVVKDSAESKEDSKYWVCDHCGVSNKVSAFTCRRCHFQRQRQEMTMEPLLPGLRTIRLAYCSNISDLGVENLCQAYPQLEHISLNHCPRLTDRTCLSLSEHCAPTLTSLHMLGCFNMSMEVFEVLLGSAQNLRSLSPPSCFSKAAAFQSEERKANCVKVPTLRELLMPASYVSDGCLSDIIPTMFPDLEVLDVSANPTLSDTAVNFATNALKNLKLLKRM